MYSVLGLNLSGNEENVTAIFDIQSVGSNIWNGGIYGIEASAATTMVLAFAAALFFVMGRKRGKKLISICQNFYYYPGRFEPSDEKIYTLDYLEHSCSR